MTFPLPGIDAIVVDEDGKPVSADKKGYLIIKKPWPGMLITLWNDDEKYRKVYWEKFGNSYYAGDYALSDNDGYIWLLGQIRRCTQGIRAQTWHNGIRKCICFA